MKKILITLILFLINLSLQAQSLRGLSLNSYKYLVVEFATWNATKNKIIKELNNYGFNVIDSDDNFPSDLEENPSLALYVSSVESCRVDCKTTITLSTINGPIWTNSSNSGISALNAAKKALKPFSSVRYKYDANKKIINKEFSNSDIDINSEESIRTYFTNNGAENIEGIWEHRGGNSTYKLIIIKEGIKYNGYVISEINNWKKGEFKANFELAATNEIVTINWLMSNKVTNNKEVGTVTNNAFIEFNINGVESVLYRVFPKLNSGNSESVSPNGWAGNGSGIIISKSGHIITNYHVIKNISEVEVEFLVNDEIENYNAEIIQSDKVNDLAILKIHDINFESLNEINYNFKLNSSDVGTKVYAFGYPMALSIMGKELKVTDGIISSKTGYDGDITCYQISAPIQGGNSGGPLFDNKGNLIGINSSGLSKEIADNVGYSIKTSYVNNLIDVLPKSISLPSSKKLANLDLVEQIKEIKKYVVLIKVK